MELEHALIKVPYEALSKTLRSSQKLLQKELSSVVGSVSDLNSRKHTLSDNDLYQSLDAIVGRLHGLKRKLEDTNQKEEQQLHVTKIRLDHLKIVADSKSSPTKLSSTSVSPTSQINTGETVETVSSTTNVASSSSSSSASSSSSSSFSLSSTQSPISLSLPLRSPSPSLLTLPSTSRWTTVQQQMQNDIVAQFKKQRLDRMLVDFMLRQGYYQAASQLINLHPQLPQLVDLDIFLAAKKVVDGLNRRDCTEALKFCIENRTKLRKIKSSLEMNLRQQEFVELVRKEALHEAIAYARKHLAPIALTHLKLIQRVMASLAFPASTPCPTYKWLFDEQRWDDLIKEFKADHYSLHSLSNEPLICLNLSAGLSALKTKQCYRPENQNLSCPVCVPEFGELASKLPYSQHTHSSLICRITHLKMDEDNYPMVLPNGNVYSKIAMQEMAAADDERVTCPRTGATFKYSQLRKAFIS